MHKYIHRYSISLSDDQLIRDLRSTGALGFAKPDECPPRKTDMVKDGKNGKKRTCPRKCSTDSDCLNDRKLCLCDGACGMSCIRWDSSQIVGISIRTNFFLNFRRCKIFRRC